MKMNSVSGVSFLVEDIAKTAHFYKALGFRFDKQERDHLRVYLNWFWLDFKLQDGNLPEFQKEKNLKVKGAGAFIYVKVENVEEFYKGVEELGFKTTNVPVALPSGVESLYSKIQMDINSSSSKKSNSHPF